MKPHQQRAIEEKRELDEKIAKLKEFVKSPAPDADAKELALMLRQLTAMDDYSWILGLRIKLWSV